MRNQPQRAALRESTFRAGKAPGAMTYAKPRITKLIPGTAAYEAARLAIEASLRAKGTAGA